MDYTPYCEFAFDDQTEGIHYHINVSNTNPRLETLPYFIPSLGINVQGQKYFTKRSGFRMLFLCLTLEGVGTVLAGKESHLLLPGDLMLLDGRKPHIYGSHSNHWKFLWMHIKGYGWQTFFSHIAPDGLFFCHLNDTSPIQDLYDTLVPLVRSTTTEAMIDASNYTGQFLHTLARLSMVGEADAPPDSLDNSLLYIRDHISQDLTVEELAARENFSVYHYTHLFTKHLGISPYRYITELRLHNAATMLIFTPKTIAEIADINHFSSASRFIQQFRQLYGMTPRRYRQCSKEGIPIHHCTPEGRQPPDPVISDTVGAD